MSEYSQAVEMYHKWYYDTGVWEKTTFQGVPCLKSVSDMWNYQEILFDLKPTLIVEFGTHSGGAALYFSMLGRQMGRPFRVLTVDVDHDRVAQCAREDRDIELMTCSSADPSVAARIQSLRAELPGPLFAILDSDHSKSHVLQELKLLRPLLRSGDYVLVEDGNINGHPVLPAWGEGPWEAIEVYEAQYPDDFSHDLEREAKFGFTFAPRGFLIRN